MQSRTVLFVSVLYFYQEGFKIFSFIFSLCNLKQGSKVTERTEQGGESQWTTSAEWRQDAEFVCVVRRHKNKRTRMEDSKILHSNTHAFQLVSGSTKNR